MAVEDEGGDIWRINFSLRKHFTSVWPRREQKSHLGRLEALFCEFYEEEGQGDDAGNVDVFWRCLGGAEDAVNAEVVEDKFAHVWSIVRSDWTTDCLSNLSRTEMVRATSSKEWRSALMMAMTASSS